MRLTITQLLHIVARISRFTMLPFFGCDQRIWSRASPGNIERCTQAFLRSVGNEAQRGPLLCVTSHIPNLSWLAVEVTGILETTAVCLV
jgi:hypothetical protein